MAAQLRRALLATSIAAVAFLVTAPSTSPLAAGSLNLGGTLNMVSADAPCPAGMSASTLCHSRSAQGVVSGLGEVTQAYTPATLTAAGWDCFQTPPFVAPPRIVCANPGVGRPIPGNPDPPPAYTLPTFDLGGNYLGRVHLVRADLYRGQSCEPTGDPYVFRAAIGYFECLRI
jgi:hypothetical protein